MQEPSSPASTPSHSLLHDLRYTMIPHRIRGIAAGLSALNLEASPEAVISPTPGHGEAVRFEDLIAYTRPVICVAAIHCCSLLHFLGLRSNGFRSLVAVSSDAVSTGEFCIRMFKGRDGLALEPVTPSIVQGYPDPDDVALAWALTCEFSAQRLSDAIWDPQLTSGRMAPMLRRTFETLPPLVDECFFERVTLRANA